LRPAFECIVGGANGSIDLGFAGFLDFYQYPAKRGVEHWLGGAFAVDQMAVDQEFGLHGLSSSKLLFFLWKLPLCGSEQARSHRGA
jgi:hypothetical protein